MLIAQIEVLQIDECERVSLQVKIDNSLLELTVKEQFTGAESSLYERILVELGNLRRLKIWCDKVVAIWHLFGSINDFLSIETTSILSQNCFEDSVIAQGIR